MAGDSSKWSKSHRRYCVRSLATGCWSKRDSHVIVAGASQESWFEEISPSDWFHKSAKSVLFCVKLPVGPSVCLTSVVAGPFCQRLSNIFVDVVVVGEKGSNRSDVVWSRRRWLLSFIVVFGRAPSNNWLVNRLVSLGRFDDGDKCRWKGFVVDEPMGVESTSINCDSSGLNNAVEANGEAKEKCVVGIFSSTASSSSSLWYFSFCLSFLTTSSSLWIWWKWFFLVVFSFSCSSSTFSLLSLTDDDDNDNTEEDDDEDESDNDEWIRRWGRRRRGTSFASLRRSLAFRRVSSLPADKMFSWLIGIEQDLDRSDLIGSDSLEYRAGGMTVCSWDSVWTNSASRSSSSSSAESPSSVALGRLRRFIVRCCCCCCRSSVIFFRYWNSLFLVCMLIFSIGWASTMARAYSSSSFSLLRCLSRVGVPLFSFVFLDSNDDDVDGESDWGIEDEDVVKSFSQQSFVSGSNAAST